jgi:hypothetical protein
LQPTFLRLEIAFSRELQGLAVETAGWQFGLNMEAMRNWIFGRGNMQYTTCKSPGFWDGLLILEGAGAGGPTNALRY